MFVNNKQWFGGKINRAVAFMLSASLFCGIAGCSKEQANFPAESNDTSVDLSNSNDKTGFDIDRVRKNIFIKGQTIEIPMKLKDLPKGWSYKLYDENDVYLRENQFLATMLYNDEEMYIATLENYYESNPQESIIYNLTIYDSDCSIDGLTPQLSTKQDVVDKYGEPLADVSLDDYYSYGIVNGENKLGGRLNNHSLGVRFTEDDIIKSISITYADLDKQD